VGNPGWAWADLLPLFIRIETDLDFGDQPIHGKAGPIIIQRYRPERWAPINRVMYESCVELGVARGARPQCARRACRRDRRDAAQPLQCQRVISADRNKPGITGDLQPAVSGMIRELLAVVLAGSANPTRTITNITGVSRGAASA